MQFLGIKVDNLTCEQARLKVRDFLVLPGQFKIFTPNPEMVVKAQKDEYFKKVLNSGDLNICDGFGLWLAIRLSSILSSQHLSTVIPTAKEESLSNYTEHQTDRDPSSLRSLGMTVETTERIPGVDFMLDICQIAEETDKNIFLLGTASEEILEKTTKQLQNKFPRLKIVGWNTGCEIKEKLETRNKKFSEPISNFQFPISDLIVDEVKNNKILEEINQTNPDIIFVAFGMGKQEKWISKNLAKMPKIKIAMGVGGSLDYISGVIPRAPLFMRRIGLEWIYRLIRQPQRFWRIFNATIIFIYYFLWEKERNRS